VPDTFTVENPPSQVEPYLSRYLRASFERVKQALRAIEDEIPVEPTPAYGPKRLGTATITTDANGNPTIVRQDGNISGVFKNTNRANDYFEVVMTNSVTGFLADMVPVISAQQSQFLPGDDLATPYLVKFDISSANRVEFQVFNANSTPFIGQLYITFQADDMTPA
jgi:hypothetical protein